MIMFRYDKTTIAANLAGRAWFLFLLMDLDEEDDVGYPENLQKIKPAIVSLF
jgi:hypothetical protein